MGTLVTPPDLGPCDDAVYALRGDWNPDARYPWDVAIYFARCAREGGRNVEVKYAGQRLRNRVILKAAGGEFIEENT